MAAVEAAEAVAIVEKEARAAAAKAAGALVAAPDLPRG
jgi:hypothetical protein